MELLRRGSAASASLRVIVMCFAITALQMALRWLRQGSLLSCVGNTIVFCGWDRKSYCSGCIQVAMVICQRISSILAPFIFFLKIPFEKRSKSSFFRVWRQDPVLGLQFLTPLQVAPLGFATQSLQIAL